MGRLTGCVLAFLLVGGCATGSAPKNTSSASRWRVVALEPGTSGMNGNTAILVDESTGNTWTVSNGSNMWTKMQR